MTDSIFSTGNTYKKSATAVLLFIALALSVVGLIPALNAILFIPFAVLLYFLSRLNTASNIKLVCFLVPTVILGFFITIFRPAGFDYPLIWATPYLYEAGKAFSLYANLSKAIGGYLVLIWFF